MTFATTLTTCARAALVALSLGATALVAMPAQAATMTVNPPSVQLKLGGPGGGVKFKFGTPDYFKLCLNDRGVVRLLSRNGYNFVRIVRSNKGDNGRNRVWATGVKHHDFYMLRVDRCSHDIRARKLGHNDRDNFNGFSLQFNF
jgi:hypothetical protein